jgi:hypothetical protein
VDKDGQCLKLSDRVSEYIFAMGMPPLGGLVLGR